MTSDWQSVSELWLAAPENSSLAMGLLHSHDVTSSPLQNESFTTAAAVAGPQAAELAYCNTASFYLHTVGAAIICLIGLVGNSISLAVLARDKQSQVATFLLQSMCVVDNSFLLLWILNFCVNRAFKYLQLEPDLHFVWLYVRTITYPILFITQTATIWITVLIAVTRYISICLPYRASTLVTLPHAKVSVLGLAIFSVLYNIPRFFEIKVIHSEEHGYKLRYGALHNNKWYQLIYFDILYYIISFVMPLVLLVFLNSRLTVAYRKIQANRARMNLRTDQDNQITLVMIIVVLVFLVCQAPARLVQMLTGYERTTYCRTIRFYLTQLSQLLEILNSSVNFFIYCIFRQQFRTSLRAMFCGHYSTVPASATRGGGGATDHSDKGSLLTNGQKNEGSPTAITPTTPTVDEDTKDTTC